MQPRQCCQSWQQEEHDNVGQTWSTTEQKLKHNNWQLALPVQQSWPVRCMAQPYSTCPTE
jgi:hypothetical protein